MEGFVNQFSEIGKLNAVLLHRPGIEIDQVTPDFFEEMLIDDTPYLPAAQRDDAWVYRHTAELLQNAVVRDAFGMPPLMTGAGAAGDPGTGHPAAGEQAAEMPATGMPAGAPLTSALRLVATHEPAPARSASRCGG